MLGKCKWGRDSVSQWVSLCHILPYMGICILCDSLKHVQMVPNYRTWANAVAFHQHLAPLELAAFFMLNSLSEVTWLCTHSFVLPNIFSSYVGLIFTAMAVPYCFLAHDEVNTCMAMTLAKSYIQLVQDGRRMSRKIRHTIDLKPINEALFIWCHKKEVCTRDMHCMWAIWILLPNHTQAPMVHLQSNHEG